MHFPDIAYGSAREVEYQIGLPALRTSFDWRFPIKEKNVNLRPDVTKTFILRKEFF